MNQRTLALAAGAVLSASLLGACTGGRQLPLKDCGTIEAGMPTTAAERAAINCWNGYHFGHTTSRYKITQTDGNTTTIFETTGPAHQVKVTTESNGAIVNTRTCGSNQVVNSQVFFNEVAGKLQLDAC